MKNPPGLEAWEVLSEALAGPAVYLEVARRMHDLSAGQEG